MAFNMSKVGPISVPGYGVARQRLWRGTPELWRTTPELWRGTPAHLIDTTHRLQIFRKQNTRKGLRLRREPRSFFLKSWNTRFIALLFVTTKVRRSYYLHHLPSSATKQKARRSVHDNQRGGAQITPSNTNTTKQKRADHSTTIQKVARQPALRLQTRQNRKCADH